MPPTSPDPWIEAQLRQLPEPLRALAALGRLRRFRKGTVILHEGTRGLTPTETRVLELLCSGVPPARIAELQGVRISTIRTQIGGIRTKTGGRSIRDVVNMVALLPPMVPVLWPVGGVLPEERVESR